MLGSNTLPTDVLQEGFSGTACEICAADNVFGPSCSAGMSRFGVVECICKGPKSDMAYTPQHPRNKVPWRGMQNNPPNQGCTDKTKVDSKSFKRQSLKGRTVCLWFSALAGSPSPGMLPDKLRVIGLPRSRLQDPTSTSSFPAQLLPEVFLDCGLSTDLLPRVFYSHHRSQHILTHPFLSGVHKHLKSSEVLVPFYRLWICPRHGFVHSLIVGSPQKLTHSANVLI